MPRGLAVGGQCLPRTIHVSLWQSVMRAAASGFVGRVFGKPQRAAEG
jgi:hypothetical protein